MLAITTAIYNKCIALPYNSFYTAIGGRLYKIIAPQNALLPYCVYWIVAESPDYTFSTVTEDIVLRFDLFDDGNVNSSSTTIETNYGYLISLYDDCKLTVSGETHLLMERMSSNLTLEEDNTWHYSVDYRIMTIKNR
jgi:hypothetical protein